MKVWAHRGASAYAPENTMEAFVEAINQGTDGIETDVHLTSDGVLVLMHDEKLDRTTDHQGYIKDYTYEQLKKVNANYHMDGFDFCHIPTLEELLKLCKEKNVELNIELKTDTILYENIERKVIDLVRAYDMEKLVWYSSFNHYSLKNLRAIDPTVRIGLLYMEALYQPWEYANWIEADALHPYFPCLVLDNYIANAHLHHVKVHPWTVNRKEDMVALKNAGIDAVITNDPALAKSI